MNPTQETAINGYSRSRFTLRTKPFRRVTQSGRARLASMRSAGAGGRIFASSMEIAFAGYGQSAKATETPTPAEPIPAASASRPSFATTQTPHVQQGPMPPLRRWWFRDRVRPLERVRSTRWRLLRGWTLRRPALAGRLRTMPAPAGGGFARGPFDRPIDPSRVHQSGGRLPCGRGPAGSTGPGK
jgi:hypothetical protein